MGKRSEGMYLFGINSVLAATLAVSAITIAWCIYLMRRIYNRRIRILAMLLSFMVVFQVLKYMHHGGLMELQTSRGMENFADLAMALFSLAAALVIQKHNLEQRQQSVRLRLAEAEQADMAGEADPKPHPPAFPATALEPEFKPEPVETKPAPACGAPAN